MKSALEVILAIIQEAGIDYYLKDDAGLNYLIEIPAKSDPDWRPIKIMCNFTGPLFADCGLTPTGVLIHICGSFECCYGKWTVLPVHGSTFHGVLEDPKFYNDLVELVNSWKEDKR
jgi:hypothetical protein